MRSTLGLSIVIASLAVPVAHAVEAEGCRDDATSPLAFVAGAVDGIGAARATALCAETKLGAILAPGLPVPPAAAGKMIVVNKGPSVGDPGTSSVMSLDLATGAMGWTTATTQQGPHEIAVSPSGRYGVAPNYGLAPQGKPPLAGEGKSITVIDFDSGKTRDIFVGAYSRPHGGDFVDEEHIAVTADGKGTDLSKGYVLIVNTRTGKIEKAMPTGQAGTHLVRVSADRTKLFATNIQGESFTVLDYASGKVLKTVHAGKGAEGFDLSPDGTEIWIGNQDDSTITILDASSLAVKQTIDAPGGPIRVKFSADGSRVFTSNRAGNSLTAYDAKTRRITDSLTFDVPRCDPVTRKPVFGKSSVPMQLVLPPGSRYGYITNSHSDLLTVVDMTDLSIQGHYKAGTKPDPMAWFAGTSSLAAYPHLAEKYPALGGNDRGTYSGEGKGTVFALPRRVDPAVDGARLASEFRVLFDTKRNNPGSMEFDTFLRTIESTIPSKVLAEIDRVIADAKRLGESGLAAPFPYAEEEKLRHTLRYSWLHSRDLTVIQSALGYPLESTGRHDIDESVKGRYLKENAAATVKDAWYRRYVATVGDDEDVNVGFFNPHWVADIYGWRPDVDAPQNAMDAHRLSGHHEGNELDGWDPIEAAVNNVYHRRELHFGIRKDLGMSWVDLGVKLETDDEAAKFIKSGIGVPVARDAVSVMKALEAEGKIVPWSLVRPGSAPTTGS